MSLFHSLGQLLARNSQSNKSHTRRRKRTLHGKRGLRFEALEDRSMLATIVVTSLADNTTVDTFVTLREALIAANTDSAVDGSTAGSGADTITFAPTFTTGGPATINLGITGDNTFGPSALLITSDVTIQGSTGANGITIGRDAAAAPVRLRLFNVGQTGSLTLNNLTLTGGVALGGNGDTNGGGGLGAGGAIVNQGALIVNASTFTGNRAQGGNGGATGINAGGGMGGDGSGFNGGGPNGGAGVSGGFGGGGGSGGSGGFGGGGGFAGTGGFGGGGGGGAGFVNFGGFGGGSGTPNSSGAGGGGAGLGGAIFNYGGLIDIKNSTFANNAAIGGTRGSASAGDGSGFGSEIFNLNGAVFLLNATLVTTNANSGSNAIYNLGDNVVLTQAGPVLPANTAHVILNNSILSNSSGIGYTTFTQNGGRDLTTGSNTLITGSVIGGANFNLQNLLTSNPLLGTLANNGGPTQTILPTGNSPVLNAGMSSANEVQKLTVGGGSGSFTLSFNGVPTAALAFNVPASGGAGPTASVENALNALTTIGGVGGAVTVTQAAGVYTITFGGSLGGSLQPFITTTAAGGATAAVSAYTLGFTVPATDQRGGTNARNVVAVDLGAVEVQTLSTTTTVVPSVVSPVFGQSFTLTATVSSINATPTGTVQFSVDGAPFGSPVALVGGQAVSGNLNTLAVGLHNYSVVYSGASNFLGSSVTSNITVNPPGVTVQLNGNTLVITGDNTADQLRLVGTANPNEFTVTGLNGTIVNGVANNAVTTSGVTNIRWNLTNGADVITMEDARVAGSVTIGDRIFSSGTKDIRVGGTGTLQGAVGSVTVGGDLTIYGGTGNGKIFVNTTTVSGAMNIYGGSGTGENKINTEYTSTGGDFSIISGLGYDLVQQTQISVGAAWLINVGAGNDLISVAQCSANGTATFISGTGIDTIAVAGSQLYGGVRMIGSDGGGAKTLNLYSTFYNGTATLTGGAQNDTLIFNNNNTGGQASLNSGGGNDTVTVLTSVLNQLFADLGDGNDTLTVRGTRSTNRPIFNGGIGIDTYNRSGNAFPGVTLSSFETQFGTGF